MSHLQGRALHVTSPRTRVTCHISKDARYMSHIQGRVTCHISKDALHVTSPKTRYFHTCCGAVVNEAVTTLFKLLESIDIRIRTPNLLNTWHAF